MGTKLVEDADPAIRIAEGDQILVQDAEPQLRNVRLGKLAGDRRRQPVAA